MAYCMSFITMTLYLGLYTNTFVLFDFSFFCTVGTPTDLQQITLLKTWTKSLVVIITFANLKV